MLLSSIKKFRSPITKIISDFQVHKSKFSLRDSMSEDIIFSGIE